MDRQNGFRPRRDGGAEVNGVEVIGVEVDIDEHRSRPESRDRAGAGEKRVRRRDHFVAARDAERHERQQQRIGSRRNSHRVLHAEDR